MTAALSHRGPDGDGFLVDERRGLALGHRRLSILDLSEAGRQPMVSAGGRFVAVLNGEIYNFALLREELERTGQAPAWRGRSDTEVVLAACEAWGVRATIERCQGMFALAIFDRVEGVLHLFRDRFGGKPLYFGVIDGIFLFASEPQALRAFPGRPGTVDRRSLARLLATTAFPRRIPSGRSSGSYGPGRG
jgi:asparagine synthase (glutamine-hydrolysing)